MKRCKPNKHEWRAIVLEKNRHYKIKELWCISCGATRVKEVNF